MRIKLDIRWDDWWGLVLFPAIYCGRALEHRWVCFVFLYLRIGVALLPDETREKA